MADQNYKLGYEDYKNNPDRTEEFLKQQHNLFRVGYRAAKSDFMKKNSVSIPAVIYHVDKTPKKPFVLEYKDILTAARRPRFAKLHLEHMRPLLRLLIKSVDDKRDSIKSLKELNAMMNTGFNIILKYAFDLKIINEYDLRKLDYYVNE